jgi:hypothetical protein
LLLSRCELCEEEWGAAFMVLVLDRLPFSAAIGQRASFQIVIRKASTSDERVCRPVGNSSELLP